MVSAKCLRLAPVVLARVVAFADSPSLAAAARVSHCDSSRIYSAVWAVERAIGFKVFIRGKGGRGNTNRHSLSPRGVAVISALRDILGAYAALDGFAALPDSDFASAAARRKTMRRLASVAPHAAGVRH